MASPMLNPLTGTEYPNLRPRSGTQSSASSSTPQDSTGSGLENAPSQPHAQPCLATGSSARKAHETSGATTLGAPLDTGRVDDASLATLHDVFPWHDVGIGKSKQKIPSAIVPVLFQGVDDISPSSRSATSEEEEGVPSVDDDVSNDAAQTGMRYSEMEKGKWKARPEDGKMFVNPLAGPRGASHDFSHYVPNNSVEDWVAHSTPILQHYANRQTSLPLGRRLDVSLDEPRQFILGGLQLLVNRDPKNCTDPSRQLGPQLIENFVDIRRWATEYFRSRHGMQAVDDDVPTLLTVITNNFYEAHVQLIDRVVEFAIENMRFCARSTLSVEDFAFGFDFRMSQDLPFYVESSSRLREPLPVRTVKPPTPEPATTKSGRQVKPTTKAQAAAQEAQKKKGGAKEKESKKTSPTTPGKAEQKPKAPTRGRGRNKGTAEPSHRGMVLQTPSATVYHTPNYGVVPSQAVITPSAGPSTSISQHATHRPIQPSNLGLPPMIPLTPPQTAPSSNVDLGNGNSASVTTPRALNSPGLNLTVHVPPRLTIVLPGLRAAASTTNASSDVGVPSSDAGSSSFSSSQAPIVPSQVNATPSASNGRGRASRARGPRQRGGRRGRGGGRGGAPQSVSSSARATEGGPNSVPATGQPQVNPMASIEAAGLDLPPLARMTLVGALRRGVGVTGVQSYGARVLSPGTVLETPTLSPGVSEPSTSHSILSPSEKKRKLDDGEA